MEPTFSRLKFNLLAVATVIPILWLEGAWPWASVPVFIATVVLAGLNWILLIIILVCATFIFQLFLPDRFNPALRLLGWLLD
jgi:polyferredoxin